MSIDEVSIPGKADQIMQRVGELTGPFRSRVPVTERERSVPRESIEELVSAGLARMLVPAEHGGSDLSIRDAVDTVAAVAYGCASTGWVSWLMMHVPHVIAMFPAAAQDAVWAGGPDVVTAGSHMGMTVEPLPGGYRITGRGAFTSGVNHAEWVYVGGTQPAEAGPPQLRYFLLEKSQFSVRDTWDTIGMRGTGSNTVVVDGLFVPDSFTLAHAEVREGTGPGAALNASPSLRLPWVATGALGFIAAMLGAAQAAYDDVLASLSAKKTPGGARVADSEELQMDVALVSARLDTAQTLLRSLADRADAGGKFTLLERAALTRTGSFAATLVLDAIDKLMELAGTSGFGTTAVVQQSWRDIHFAAAHISLSKRGTWGRYGRAVLGIEEKAPGIFF
ncbi:MAG TPA: acyl-CoA dehydrogenase family protein [Trebonia sp.]